MLRQKGIVFQQLIGIMGQQWSILYQYLVKTNKQNPQNENTHNS